MDRDLVERGRRGDRDAYELLARASAPRLFSIAYRVLRNRARAEDAVQQTLIAIWRELPGLRDADRFEAWTYRLGVRFALEEARRWRRWDADVRLLPADEPEIDDTAIAVDLRDQLERAFRRLTPEHRAVVVLQYHLGLSAAEIAETLGIAVGTVGSRLHYATLALPAAVEADARAEAPAGGPA